MNYGFVKVAAAIPHVAIADSQLNRESIQHLVAKAAASGVQVVTFPELSLTGYTCADLFGQDLLLKTAEDALLQLLLDTAAYNIVVIVGMPLACGSQLINSAIVLYQGQILGVVPKTFMPNYNEFYEQRWFASADALRTTTVNLFGQDVPLGANLLFKAGHMTFGVEICEDLWAPIPPSSTLALQGADVIFNLSASNESISKHNYLRQLISQQSARCLCGYVYAGCGFGESTTDLVFGGNGLIYENGTLLAASQRFSLDEQLIIADIDIERLHAGRRNNKTFSACIAKHTYTNDVFRIDTEFVANDIEITRTFDPYPFVPAGPELDARCEEIFAIQINGLAQRLVHTQVKTIVVGISGGLDSTLALLVCALTMDKLGWSRERIVGITMPGFGTTDRTYHNALHLMQNLGITIREIPIRDACMQHFHDIGHDATVHDVTYENSQARERTQILMDVANQTGGFVIGTGDLSELALGWATYNGDHMSMYGVNVSIPKTLVRHLVQWVADHKVKDEVRSILVDIVDTPISPELIPADAQGRITQKTEDLVGPYELHDFFLYYFLRFGFRPAKLYFMAEQAFKGKYEAATLKHWLRTFFKRFFAQQFKRSCLPDGPKVGSVTLSPRGDWRMPSDAKANAWLNEIDKLITTSTQ